MQLSEAQLMEGFRAGNPDCLRYIFDNCHRCLFYFVMKRLNDEEAAGEIISEAYVKLWEQRAAFNGFQDIEAFLFASARSACLEYLCKRSTDDNSTIEHDLIEIEVVKHYLQELPAQSADIVMPLTMRSRSIHRPRAAMNERLTM